MRKLTLCAVVLSLTATPAMAQMGGMGGGGGAGSGHTTAIDPDAGTNIPGLYDNVSSTPKEMKPITLERFDKAVASLFAMADLNRDGMVTLAELQTVIETRRETVVAARFKEIDTNHDGRIDLAEFSAWQKEMGSAAGSACGGYAGQGQIVPDALYPDLSSSEQDDAIGTVIEPLSEMVLIRANIHYHAGITLDDLLAYENIRFNAADTNHDGFLEQQEISDLRKARAGHGSGTQP